MPREAVQGLPKPGVFASPRGRRTVVEYRGPDHPVDGQWSGDLLSKQECPTTRRWPVVVAGGRPRVKTQQPLRDDHRSMAAARILQLPTDGHCTRAASASRAQVSNRRLETGADLAAVHRAASVKIQRLALCADDAL